MDTKQANLTGPMRPCLFGTTTQRSVGVISPTWINKKQLFSLCSCPAVLPGRWDLRVCENAPRWRSESTKSNKKKKNRFPVLSESSALTLVECETTEGHARVLLFSWSESQGRKSSTKTEDLSAFWLYYSPKKKIHIPSLRVGVILFFVHPSVAYRSQKHNQRTWGLKDQQRSPSHPTHSVEVISDFQFFFSKHNSVSFKTFSQSEKRTKCHSL